jgi:hypothetical protein
MLKLGACYTTFGGNIEMYGILDSISSGPIDARTSNSSTMVCGDLMWCLNNISFFDILVRK